MDEAPNPSAYNAYRRQHEYDRGPATKKEPDLPRIRMDHPPPRHIAANPDASGYLSAAHGSDSLRHPQRANSLIAPSVTYTCPTASLPSTHSAQNLLSNSNEMSSMLSEFTLGSPTISSSSSSSPASPFIDRRALQPSVYTMRMGSNSLEIFDDHENRAALYSLMESSDDYCAQKNMGTLPFTTHDLPQINDQRGHWLQSPMENLVGRRPYDYPSRSASSQSDTSHSTSESESTPDISSFPNGTAHHSSNAASAGSAGGASRKNKMHQCEICKKWFPRPSGLATHMNSHSGAKPFKCPVSDCDKSFTVRSNAKRHLKIHRGASSPAESSAPQSSFSVGFEAPYVAHNRDSGEALPKLKWVSSGSSTQTAMDGHDSPSSSEEADGGPVPPSPHSAVYPSDSLFESREGYDSAHSYSKNW